MRHDDLLTPDMTVARSVSIVQSRSQGELLAKAKQFTELARDAAVRALDDPKQAVLARNHFIRVDTFKEAAALVGRDKERGNA